MKVRLFTDGGEGPLFNWPTSLIEEFRAAHSKCLRLGPNLFLCTVIRRMKKEVASKAEEIQSWRMFHRAYRREVVHLVRFRETDVIVQVRKKR